MWKAQQQHMTSVQKYVRRAGLTSLDQRLLLSRQVNWRDLMEMYVGCGHCMLLSKVEQTLLHNNILIRHKLIALSYFNFNRSVEA